MAERVLLWSRGDMEDEMLKRMIGLAVIIFGTLVLIVSLTADPIGIGGAPNVVGYKQLTGAGVGIMIAIIGLWFSQGAEKSQPK